MISLFLIGSMVGFASAVAAAKRPSLTNLLKRLAWIGFASPLAAYASLFLPFKPVVHNFALEGIALLFFSALFYGAFHALLSKNFTVTSGFAVALLCLSFTVGYFLWKFNQCRVTITNRSGHDISQAIVSSSGPPVQIEKIKNGRSKTVRIYPQGESGVLLTYVGEEGRPVKGGGGYVEAAGYHVYLVVDPGDKISFHYSSKEKSPDINARTSPR